MNYFDALVSNPAFYKGYSLRPIAGAPKTSPYYEKQLLSQRVGGFVQTGKKTTTACVLYDVTMDAAKIIIPTWHQSFVLDAPLSATDGLLTGAFLGNSGWANHTLKVGAELITIERGYAITVDDAGVSHYSYPILRGQFGTTPLPHLPGTVFQKNGNSLDDQVRVPVGTQNGHQYLFVWDAYWTPSYLGSLMRPMSRQKTFQLASSGIWMEPGCVWNGTVADGDATPSLIPGFDGTKHIAGYALRAYDAAPTGMINRNPVAPAVGQFILHPDRWTRMWVLIDQRDGVQSDLLSTWTADAVQGVIQVHDQVPCKVRMNKAGTLRTIEQFYLEFNTSTDELFPSRAIDQRDLVAYVRNIAVLKDATVSPLLTTNGL
jgi:hypothetical protein